MPPRNEKGLEPLWRSDIQAETKQLSDTTSSTPTAADLQRQFVAARERLDRRTDLLRWSMTLRALLHAGLFDVEQARDAVDQFKHDVGRERRLT